MNIKKIGAIMALVLALGTMSVFANPAEARWHGGWGGGYGRDFGGWGYGRGFGGWGGFATGAALGGLVGSSLGYGLGGYGLGGYYSPSLYSGYSPLYNTGYGYSSIVSPTYVESPYGSCGLY